MNICTMKQTWFSEFLTVHAVSISVAFFIILELIFPNRKLKLKLKFQYSVVVLYGAIFD